MPKDIVRQAAGDLVQRGRENGPRFIEGPAFVAREFIDRVQASDAMAGRPVTMVISHDVALSEPALVLSLAIIRASASVRQLEQDARTIGEKLVMGTTLTPRGFKELCAIASAAREIAKLFRDDVALGGPVIVREDDILRDQAAADEKVVGESV